MNEEKKNKLRRVCACVRSANVIRLWLCIRKCFHRTSNVDNFRDEEKQTLEILGLINIFLIVVGFFFLSSLGKKKLRKGQRYFKHWNCSSSLEPFQNEWEHFETKANFKTENFVDSMGWCSRFYKTWLPPLNIQWSKDAARSHFFFLAFVV